jgi:hypothetical protein
MSVMMSVLDVEHFLQKIPKYRLPLPPHLLRCVFGVSRKGVSKTPQKAIQIEFLCLFARPGSSHKVACC